MKLIDVLGRDRAIARKFIWGFQYGVRTKWPKATSGGGENFWNFCFEMVHFGAKVTNPVHLLVFGGLQ